MIYTISDLHGEYTKYIAMLEKIGFKDDDILYILGDVLDRGPEPIRILQDMAARPNVFPILGNHEAMAISVLPRLMVEVTQENYDSHMDAELMQNLLEWQMNGNASAMAAFQKLPRDEQWDLLDYLKEFQLYETADVGDRTFVMVHAGLQNFDSARSLSSYRAEELVLGRHDLQKCYFDDRSVYVITGHTPTLAITGKPEILHVGNNICIDCGATFEGGKLACLCLNTMEEFYV